MGLVANANRAAEQLKRKKRTRGKAAEITATRETQTLLKEFPDAMRERILKKGIRAALGEVRKAARADLSKTRSDDPSRPDIGRSKYTGTRDYWSKKIAGRRGESKDMWQAMAVSLRTYKGGAMLYGTAGPRHPWGNLAVIHELGGTIQLWGGKPYRLPARPFLRPAADNTKTEQQRAIVGKLKTEWTKL